MTSSKEAEQIASKNQSPLRWLIASRGRIRRRINLIEPIDRALHIYLILVLLLNIFFILYAMISLTSRMLQNGVPFIDSIPLAFYIIPLLVFLPKLLVDYYRSRSAILTIVILLIVSVVFGMISTLVRGFMILAVLNVVSISIIFILGRFRPTAPIRSIGKKGVAWILILNSLGLMLPASVYLMGQYPIATATFSETTTIYLEMPLGSFEYQFVNITATESLLSGLEALGFGIDLRVSYSEPESLDRLASWLLALSNSSVPYRITISSNRETSRAAIVFSPDSFDLLATTDSIISHYANLFDTIERVLTILDNLTISSNNLQLYADMRLSDNDWTHLMNLIKGVNLLGFSNLVRESLDATNSSRFTSFDDSIESLLESRTVDLSFIVEGFAIDDLLDGDVTMMEFCGITPAVLSSLDADLEVACDRSRYSEAMDGDVGEYLVHTYSVSPFVSSMRIGVAGSSTGLESIRAIVYQSLDELASDIVIASGNGVEEIVVASLPSILSSFGNAGIIHLSEAIQSLDSVEITYTFRIYAFRAVVMAIDSFDFFIY